MTVLLLSAGWFDSDDDGYLLNDPSNNYKLNLNYEKGFIGVLSHKIQFGVNGTYFDYVAEGGQNVLLPFERFTAEVKIGKSNSFTLLYQPLNIVTEEFLERDITVDSILFPAGTPVALTYGFSFYRLSWLYDFLKSDDRELAFGLSFQIRNANIQFASKDGDLLTVNNNIGPVPILKARGSFPLENKLYFGFEADGFYADGKYITGSANDFIGAIYDASVRMGGELRKNLDGYINLRFVGGGAVGTDESYDGQGDGYTKNWLHTVALSIGFVLK